MPARRRERRRRLAGSARWRSGSAARTAQPGSGRVGSGGSPEIACSGVCGGASSFGIAASKRLACRACASALNSVRVGARSTTRPAYITATSSGAAGDDAQVVRDQDHRHVPPAAARGASRSRICACTVTSSAVVGSSAISSLGSQDKAMAMATRWRMPPESWCGYWLQALLGLGMPTAR